MTLFLFLKNEWKMIDIKNYNSENIFAKILRKEIPSEMVYEDNEVLAFRDINPIAPVHILIIPKKQYCSFEDFSKDADDKTICAMIRSISKITRKLNIKNGYRLVTNIGKDGGQEVPHFHVHLLSGKEFGRILP